MLLRLISFTGNWAEQKYMFSIKIDVDKFKQRLSQIWNSKNLFWSQMSLEKVYALLQFDKIISVSHISKITNFLSILMTCESQIMRISSELLNLAPEIFQIVNKWNCIWIFYCNIMILFMGWSPINEYDFCASLT